MTKQNETRFVIFAAFWNESSNLELALKELDRLAPDKVYVSEGCFDMRRPPRSTDETREIIASWATGRDNVFSVEPVRGNKLFHAKRDWSSFLAGGFGGGLGALLLLLRRLLRSTYRLNQSETFNNMLRAEGSEGGNFWFMTFDADECYDLAAHVNFRRIRSIESFEMLVTSELTIVGEGKAVAPWYPTSPIRTWNVPVRYASGMKFMFTREVFGFLGASSKVFRPIVSFARKAFIGHTVHMKLDCERIALGVSLGDRRPPSHDRMRSMPFLANEWLAGMDGAPPRDSKSKSSS